MAISVEAIVTDAVLAFVEDVDQQPTDDLGRRQRHGGVTACAFKSVNGTMAAEDVSDLQIRLGQLAAAYPGG